MLARTSETTSAVSNTRSVRVATRDLVLNTLECVFFNIFTKKTDPPRTIWECNPISLCHMVVEECFGVQTFYRPFRASPHSTDPQAKKATNCAQALHIHRAVGWNEQIYKQPTTTPHQTHVSATRKHLDNFKNLLLNRRVRTKLISATVRSRIGE